MNLCVASQRVFVVVVYFVSDSVRQLLVIPSYSLITIVLTRLIRSMFFPCDT
jgi:hypothetical protein